MFSDATNVLELDCGRPTFREHASTEGLDLDLKERLRGEPLVSEPALDAEFEPADPREQGTDPNLLHERAERRGATESGIPRRNQRAELVVETRERLPELLDVALAAEVEAVGVEV